MRTLKTSLRRTARAGFSLIELLAVIVIIGILVAFLLPKLGASGAVVKMKATKAFLTQVETACGSYSDEFGRYPKSRYDAKWGIGANNVNIGSEALVLQLWSQKWGGTNLTTDRLMNTDGDRSKNDVIDTEIVGDGQLMELVDEWENPIAYIERRDYGEKFLYTTYDEDGNVQETEVGALKNSSGAYYQPKKFQLISAGIDGIFGTEDDITNFKRD